MPKMVPVRVGPKTRSSNAFAPPASRVRRGTANRSPARTDRHICPSFVTTPYISLVINIYFLFCRTNSVRDLIFV
jgi:hypothetical protein